MRHSNFNKKYREIESLEREELKKAVLAHGGEFRFFSTEDWEGIDGVSMPIVMGGNINWESNCDCCITRVAVVNGSLEIYGYDKDYGDEEVLIDFVEYGYLHYIIGEIPETKDVHDVTATLPVNEVAIVSLCREDIKDAGYSPDISDEDLQQVASRVAKYFEWQDFWSQNLENIREACDYLAIPALNENR